MDDLWPAVRGLGVALGNAAVVVVSEVGPPLWRFLADHPQVQALLYLALLVFGTYWFGDGVRNWRRKCVWCRGRGAFSSKLSKRLDRPCGCCAGSGRHTTIRRRIVDRIRH